MVDFAYDKFVVVAEKEWKLEYEPGSGSRTIKFPVTIGDIEWQMSSSVSGYIDLLLTCTSVTERCVDQVHAEIHGYRRMGNAPNYEQAVQHLDNQLEPYVTTPLRHVFKPNNYFLKFMASIGSDKASILFTVRILKDRALLPNFKSEAIEIGSRVNNVKLHIADQTFYANKELLSAHSKYFDRMFNGEFKEANQEEVELRHDHEPVHPALFEDFLLVICVLEALPNRKNLVDLFRLADYYEADNVREKCERHFRMCREMPVEERYMLALELGNEQMKDSIMKSVDSAGMKRIISVHEKERAEQQLKLTNALAKNDQLTEALANTKKPTSD